MSEKRRPVSAVLTTRGGKFLLIALLLAMAAIFVWSRLPGGAYPSDLSRIGAGRPAAVLVYDPNYAGGGRVMEILNKVRGDYAERMDFLIAHLGYPAAEAFARRHAAADGTVLVFAADGSPIAAVHRPQDEEALRRALDAASR